MESSCNIRDKSVQLSILGHNCMHLSNIVINSCQLEGQCSLGLRNMSKITAWRNPMHGTPLYCRPDRSRLWLDWMWSLLVFDQKRCLNLSNTHDSSIQQSRSQSFCINRKLTYFLHYTFYINLISCIQCKALLHDGKVNAIMTYLSCEHKLDSFAEPHD